MWKWSQFSHVTPGSLFVQNVCHTMILILKELCCFVLCFGKWHKRSFYSYGYSQEGEEDVPPPSPQPKPTKVPPENKPKPATPPPVTASDTREEEDEGDKIMAELQVWCMRTHTHLSSYMSHQTCAQTQSICVRFTDFCIVGVGCIALLPVVIDFHKDGKGWALTAAKEVTSKALYCTHDSCRCGKKTQNSSLLKTPNVLVACLHSSGFPEVHS